MADDGRAPYEAGENFCMKPFRPDINEDPQNIFQEAGRNSSNGVSELSTHQDGSSAATELEQMLKQMNFTRTTKESPSEMNRATPPLPGDKKVDFHAAVVNSRVFQGKIASSAEHAIGTAQEPNQDSELFISNAENLPIISVASPQHPATVENLPDELLSNIFIRLMAKQLAQMRSVSKSWNVLLSQSSFVKSHLTHSIHNNDQILLVFYRNRNLSSSDYKPFTTHSCRSPHLELPNFIKLPFNPEFENPKGIRVIGSVNGLICSCYGNFVIHIWNPSLSAVLTLPPYSMPTGHFYKIDLRFGFDPRTDDYKVIKVARMDPTAHVEIYSMRKGFWKLITQRIPLHIKRIFDYYHVCVDDDDGHLHWLGFSGEKMDLDSIVAFDLVSETFREIPLPHSTLVDESCHTLGVVGGKLCVMSWLSGGAREVWVMEEYGVPESWVKRHAFPPFSVATYALGFTSQDAYLFEVNYRCLVLYDPVANNAKMMENYCPGDYGPDKIVEYVDSLVWVAPAEHEMVDSAGQNPNPETSGIILYMLAQLQKVSSIIVFSTISVIIKIVFSKNTEILWTVSLGLCLIGGLFFFFFESLKSQLSS